MKTEYWVQILKSDLFSKDTLRQILCGANWQLQEVLNKLEK